MAAEELLDLVSSSSPAQSEWTGYQYDLLPRIFHHYDKHLQISILQMMVAEHDSCVFNPYTKESLLRRLKTLLAKTHRWAEYEEVLRALSQYDSQFSEENMDELMAPMMEKTQEVWAKVTSLTNDLIELYFDEEEDMHMQIEKRAMRADEISRIHSQFEENGLTYFEVTFARIPGEVSSVDYEKYKDPIDRCIRKGDQREKLHELYEFARLLFELYYNPEKPDNPDSYLPQVQFSLEKYINLVGPMMHTLRQEWENDGEPETHEYLDFCARNQKHQSKAYWGVICCKLLQGDFSQDSVDALRNLWDETKETKPLAVAAKERAWLLHWVLYQNFLNEKESRQGLAQIWEMFYKDPIYKYTIITVCPWLLRYLVLSAVCSLFNLQQKLEECHSLANGLLGKEITTYKDPLTQFLRSLFIDCDFDQAASHLKECRKVFATDIFLCSSCNLFFSQARLLLFSRYSSVNMRMDINKIGELLMLGEFGKFEDDHLWSIGGQPVHREKRPLKQWITDTVRSLQKERTTAEQDKDQPTFNIKIDVRNNMLLAEPSYEDPMRQLLQQTKGAFGAAKQFAQVLR